MPGSDDDGPLVVQGRDAATGRPRLVTMRAAEVADAVRPVTDEIVRTLAACLDDLPPQAIADVLSEGVLVFGGGSLVRGFPEELERGLGLPVKVAEEPLTCVAEVPPGRCATAPSSRPTAGVDRHGVCTGPVVRTAVRCSR